MRPYCLLLAAAVFLTAQGCGSSNIAPVSGKVTLDGRPLKFATVIFEPNSSSKNPGPGSQGKTDAEGRYTLQLMTKDVKGAIIGAHKVMITAYEGDDAIPSSGSDMAFRKLLVPAKYNSSSELTFEVPGEGSDSADFDLKSK